MCGFVGVFNSELSQETLKEQLIASTRCLIHRGPDSSGMKMWDGVGLGFRRLSIIDVSSAGDQPMGNEARDIWIVLNGEIYNYIELRADLKDRGYHFRSETDTEVLLCAYEQYGVKALEMLRGMFSFIIWDMRNQQLLIARDRFGEKPLFWSHNRGNLYVASEMKALFNFQEIDTSWNATALNAYLHLGYVPAPYSSYNGIQKLPPAQYVMFKREQAGKMEIMKEGKYWDLQVPANNYSISIRDAKERALELLKESVRLQLRSDVPLGAFLSGGIDSSMVIAMMKLCGVSDIKAFSIGFEEDKFNELPYAKNVAKHLGVDHYFDVVTESSLKDMERIFDFYDEPFADSSAIPTYYVSRLAREHVTVSLSGDGGDELFVGYSQYMRIGAKNRFYAIPQMIRSGISKIGKGFIRQGSAGGSFIRYIGLHPAEKFISITSDDSFIRFLSPEFLNWVTKDPETTKWREMFFCEPSVRCGQFVDQKFYLADDILTKVDRSSMAVSLESRVPFLDYKFAEFINTLPTEFKLSKNVQKYMLKELAADYLPKEIVHRSKKGFSIPLKRWLATSFFDNVMDKLTSSIAIIDKTAINQIRNNIKDPLSNTSADIWKLLSLIHFSNPGRYSRQTS